MSRRVRLPSLATIVTTAITLFVLYLAFKSGLLQKEFKLLRSATRPESHAERMADMLLKTPECAMYRKQILAYKGRSDSSEQAADEVTRLYEAGKAAGCLKAAAN